METLPEKGPLPPNDMDTAGARKLKLCVSVPATTDSITVATKLLDREERSCVPAETDFNKIEDQEAHAVVAADEYPSLARLEDREERGAEKPTTVRLCEPVEARLQTTAEDTNDTSVVTALDIVPDALAA
jgi:hypothetical protein